MCTIVELFTFTPEGKEIYDFDKDIINKFMCCLDRGVFYLGGQVKMTHNDIINLDSIQQVREINKKTLQVYGEPCNSFEAASINTSKKELDFIENMIIKYNDIIEAREKNKKLD